MLTYSHFMIFATSLPGMSGKPCPSEQPTIHKMEGYRDSTLSVTRRASSHTCSKSSSISDRDVDLCIESGCDCASGCEQWCITQAVGFS